MLGAFDLRRDRKRSRPDGSRPRAASHGCRYSGAVCDLHCFWERRWQAFGLPRRHTRCAMTRRWFSAMVVVATTVAYTPELYADDAPAQNDDPCGPLLAHIAGFMPDGVVTPDIYVGEGLTDYLQRDDREPRATLAVTSAACREQIRRDPSGPVTELVRDALTRQPGWVKVELRPAA